MKDLTGSRAARLHDRIHLLGLAMKFPGLADPSASPYLVSFSYTAEADAETAAGAVRNAERILSTHLGVTFGGNYPHPIGSAAHYQRVARIESSGLYVYIVARAEVGPLVEAREDDTSDAGELVAA